MPMTGAVLQGLRGSDAYQYSVAHLAMNASDWNTTMHTIAGQCWPTYVSSQHLGLLQVRWPRADSRYAPAILNTWVGGQLLTSERLCGAGSVGAGGLRALRGGGRALGGDAHAAAGAEGAPQVPAAAQHRRRRHRRLKTK